MIGVVLERRVVFVVMKTGLNRIAAGKKILAIDVGDHHLLAAELHAIEPAVGVLFEHREISRVVLIAVRIEVAEDAQAGFLVKEDEASEIAVEGLDARASRNRIVGVRKICELGFDKSFLKSDVRIE